MVVQPDVRIGTQQFAQIVEITAKIGEVSRHGERTIRDHIKPVGLPLGVPQPKPLSQRHVLAVPFVVEVSEDHRVTVVIPQRHRLCGQPRLAALGLVVAQNVGTQAPLLHLCARRLVVGNPLSRDVMASTTVDLPEPMSPVIRPFLPSGRKVQTR